MTSGDDDDDDGDDGMEKYSGCEALGMVSQVKLQ